MAATNQRKRNWIRTLYDLSVENHISFQSQLQQSRKEASEAGFAGTIQSFSGNGVSTSFAGMSAADAENLIGQIEDLHDKAVDDLESQSISSPDDEQIRDAMLALTPQKVRVVYNDYSGLAR